MTYLRKKKLSIVMIRVDPMETQIKADSINRIYEKGLGLFSRIIVHALVKSHETSSLYLRMNESEHVKLESSK